MKNQKRIEAEKQYKKALAELKKAESQTNEEVYNMALKNINEARIYLVEMEIAFPTKQEYKKESNYLYLANRGIAN